MKIQPIYPAATALIFLDQTAKDPFPESGPVGVTVHYTADDSVDAAAKALVQRDLGYHLIIGRDGSVCQMTSLTRQVWHAGKALWRGRSPNHTHVAVSLVSWGVLGSKQGVFTSYSGKIIPSADVATRAGNVSSVAYPWHAATDAQFSSLLRTLTWFINVAGISPDDVCGHDEAALPFGRKQDPGGVIRLPMTELRNQLKANRNEYDEKNA